MKTSKRHSSWVILLAITFLVSPSTGCDDKTDAAADGGVFDAGGYSPDGPPVKVQCNYRGQLYNDQTEFAADDGCNSCFCNPLGNTPGQVGCGAKYCGGVPDAGGDAAGDARNDAQSLL